jgi:undecaprenyl-diphosphatase
LTARSETVAAISGYGLLAGAAAFARRAAVAPAEAGVFRSINAAPAALLLPMQVVMQAGSLGGALVTSAVASGAGLGGGRRLGATMAVTSTTVWASCKVIKRIVARGRPAELLGGVLVHGSAQSGLGFPSGHTAITFALASLAAPHLPAGAAATAWTVAGATGVARIAVGAHLPLDVVGGVVFGLAAAATARLALRALHEHESVSSTDQPLLGR